MEHLACFVPGMLALGAHAGAVRGPKAGQYLGLAEELTRTCWQMYAQMPSGARRPRAAAPSERPPAPDPRCAC